MAKQKEPTPQETAAEEKAEAQRAAAATLQAKQTVLPTQADPSLPPIPTSALPGRARDAIQDTYDYLNAAGWEHVGTNEQGVGLWRDPTHDGKCDAAEGKIITLTLPVKDGGEPMVVKQAVTPPCDWEYPTEQAALTQRQREHWAKRQQRQADRNLITAAG